MLKEGVTSLLIAKDGCQIVAGNEAAAACGMSDPQASTSEESCEASPDMFYTHQVSRMDTLAGLAVRYHVTVSDIKRANGLLSDSGMFAKDTLLIPRRAMPAVGVQYSTWAGMIVAQYGRIESATARLEAGQPGGGGLSAFPQAASPPGTGNASAALSQLRGYYGLGDSASEPGDFKPGAGTRGLGSAVPGGPELAGAEGIELMVMEAPAPRPSGLPEFAGTCEGHQGDERLRRRRATDSQGAASGSGAGAGGSAEPCAYAFPTSWLPGGAQAAAARPPLARGSPAQRAASSGLGPDPGGGGGARGGGEGRRESLLERIKRVASQPALAGSMGAPGLGSVADAAIASFHGPRAMPQAAPMPQVLDRASSPAILRRSKELVKSE